MKIESSQFKNRFLLILALCFAGVPGPWLAEAGGTWTPLTSLAPAPIGLMLLLSDGTVMALGTYPVSNAWYRLTPDIQGSYVNGSWTPLSPMRATREYFSSDMLRDGRIFVAGAEYGSGTNSAEIYDPLTDAWSSIPAAGQTFLESSSEVLPDGKVLVAPFYPRNYGGTLLYDPTSGTWSAGGTLYRGSNQSEASWVKLPDQSILTVDPFGTNSERYIPALSHWVDDGILPVSLYDTNRELGAALLLPNAKALFLGGTGHTALYTPSGTIAPGTWVAGPDIPGGLTASDAAAAMMVNGKVLCAAGPGFDPPTSFFEYDPFANLFTLVNSPGFSDIARPFYTMMLALPDGTVLYSDAGSRLFNYVPDGVPLADGKPTISRISRNPDGSYHLVGTLLNGISEGAAYGDDGQMSGNYPIVRITDADSRVYYARTHDWSSTGVMTGNTPVTTEFNLPATLPLGTFSLAVAANGNASEPVPFTNSAALQVLPSTGFATAGPGGGPFTPSARTFLLANIGTSTVSWSFGSTALWLSASPTAGTLTPSGPPTSVTVGLNAAATNLGVGTYESIVWFTNTTDGLLQSRLFTLQVTQPQLVQNGGFESGDVTNWTLSGAAGYTFVDSGLDIGSHSGTYALALGTTGSFGFLSQTLATVPGLPYLLSFWLWSPDGLTPTELVLQWNGATNLHLLNIPAIGWTNLQCIVAGPGGNSTIKFGFQNDVTYIGLDDITVRPIPPPVLRWGMTNNTVRLSWNTLAGLKYQAQFTTSLSNTNWINLGTAATASGSTLDASDSVGPDPSRFYRIVLSL